MKPMDGGDGGIFSAARITTLISSLVVSMCSGTNYVFSGHALLKSPLMALRDPLLRAGRYVLWLQRLGGWSTTYISFIIASGAVELLFTVTFAAYAPQLATRLGITHTQLNIIALAGNVGVYSTGPIWGKIVDRRGPRILLACAFLFLLTGYSGMRHFYDEAEPLSTMMRRFIWSRQDGPTTSPYEITILHFCILVFCSFLTGAGGNAGLTSSVNASAKSFPDHLRGSAVGLVISGFGLSAFLFSTIAHVIYPGDTSSFLLVLALGTALPMIAGFFLVRPIPLPSHRRRSLSIIPEEAPLAPDADELEEEDEALATAGITRVGPRSTSQTPLLSDHPAFNRHDTEDSYFGHEDHGLTTRENQNAARSVEMLTSPPPPAYRNRRPSHTSHRRSTSRVIESVRELHGRALLVSGDFWLLFTILTLLSGTGLMYINNIGSISQALSAQNNPNYDEIEAAKWQSIQVSTISIGNFSGRIIIGLLADLVKSKLNSPRSFCISLVAATFVLSQYIASSVTRVADLWQASALLGLAYGGAFGLFPTMTIEWFGLTHFSENWGFVSVSPMIGGNLFSLAFGRNLDNHAAPDPDTASLSSLLTPNITNTNTSLPIQDLTGRLPVRAGLPSTKQCFQGRECYVSSLYMTIGACSLALALSLYAALKDKRRMMTDGPARQNRDGEVVWQAEADD